MFNYQLTRLSQLTTESSKHEVGERKPFLEWDEVDWKSSLAWYTALWARGLKTPHSQEGGAKAGKRMYVRATYGLRPKMRFPVTVVIVARNAGYTRETRHSGGTHKKL